MMVDATFCLIVRATEQKDVRDGILHQTLLKGIVTSSNFTDKQTNKEIFHDGSFTK
jgi:hypothetical protein